MNNTTDFDYEINSQQTSKKENENSELKVIARLKSDYGLLSYLPALLIFTGLLIVFVIKLNQSKAFWLPIIFIGILELITLSKFFYSVKSYMLYKVSPDLIILFDKKNNQFHINIGANTTILNKSDIKNIHKRGKSIVFVTYERKYTVGNVDNVFDAYEKLMNLGVAKSSEIKPEENQYSYSFDEILYYRKPKLNQLSNVPIFSIFLVIGVIIIYKLIMSIISGKFIFWPLLFLSFFIIGFCGTYFPIKNYIIQYKNKKTVLSLRSESVILWDNDTEVIEIPISKIEEVKCEFKKTTETISGSKSKRVVQEPSGDLYLTVNSNVRKIEHKIFVDNLAYVSSRINELIKMK